MPHLFNHLQLPTQGDLVHSFSVLCLGDQRAGKPGILTQNPLRRTCSCSCGQRVLGVCRHGGYHFHVRCSKNTMLVYQAVHDFTCYMTMSLRLSKLVVCIWWNKTNLNATLGRQSIEVETFECPFSVQQESLWKTKELEPSLRHHFYDLRRFTAGQ